MRYTLLFVFLLFSGFSYAQDEEKCQAKDILKLKEKAIMNKFFSKLDSVISVKYKDEEYNPQTYLEIKKKALNRFLNDLDVNDLCKNHEYTVNYEFGVVPEDFESPKDSLCKDRITLSFDSKKRDFRVDVVNKFYVEHGCTENMVSYVFKLTRSGIEELRRYMAG